MQVILVDLEDLGLTFIAEKTPDDSSPSTGILGWFARKRTALLAELEQPSGRVSAFFGGIWNRLHRRISPIEHLLRRLRHAKSLAIHHPARLTPQDVESIWTQLLENRLRKHRFWLVVNAFLVVPATLAAALPGPNVIGFWVAYRLVTHWLVLRGIRAEKTLPRSLVPRTALDEIVVRGDDNAIARIAADLEIPALAALLAAHLPPNPKPEAPRCD